MKGFTDKALILMPHSECYENKSDDYYKLLRKALDNIVAFCKHCGMTPQMLMSDTTAMEENRLDVEWVQTLTPGDLRFAIKNCGVRAKQEPVKLIEQYKKVLSKYPGGDPSKVEDYFSVMMKRVSRLEKDYIKSMRCIINIQTKNNSAYNVKPTAESGVILIQVSNVNFMPTAYLGDMEINPIELLDFPTANQPVIDWRFTD